MRARVARDPPGRPQHGRDREPLPQRLARRLPLRRHLGRGLIDPWLYRVFKDVYAMPFTVVGESHHYMGSDPVPVGMALDGPTYDDLARRNPEFWAWILEGASAEEIAASGVCRSCSRARARSTWSGRPSAGSRSEAGRSRR